MSTTIPTDALTTRQKVKDYLGISDAGSDTVIDEIITYVTSFIKSYTGRKFLSATYIETYDTYRTRRSIFLKQYPVTAVTTVAYRSGTRTNPIWVAYNPDDYIPYLEEGYVKFYGYLPELPQGLQITYTAGYLIDFTAEFSATHTLPADITMAATELCAKLLNTRKSLGIIQETTEGQSISYSLKTRDLDENTATVLDRYKRKQVAR